MRFVEIVGPNDYLERIVRSLQEEGVLHIEEVPLAEYDDRGALHRVALSDEQQREMRTLEELTGVLDEAVGHLPQPVVGSLAASPEVARLYKYWELEDVQVVGVAARTLHAKVRSFARRHRNLADDLRVLESYAEVANALSVSLRNRVLPESHEFVGLVFGKKSAQAQAMFKDRMQRLTYGDWSYNEAALSGGRVAAFVGFPKRRAPQVHAFMAEAGIDQMSIPRHLRGMPFTEALGELKSELVELRERERALKGRSERFFRESGAELLALQRVCRDRFSRMDALSKFASTRYTFVIRGWLPSRALGGLERRLVEESENTAVVRVLNSRAPERPAPVELDNSGPSRHFEPLVKLIALPRYGTVDPTRLVAGFFPPMFGLMLGDMGYGAIFAIGAVLLLLFAKGRPLMRSIGIIAAASAFFTILFGALFGEFFGTFGHSLGIHPLWHERFVASGPGKAEAVLGYLALTVGIGVFHVLLGLVLGIINYRRVGDRAQLLGNVTKIVGLIVLFFFVGRLVQILPPVFTTLTVAALVAFLVLMVFQIVHKPVHGALLPLEVINTVGNILSYVRIMAIGMASVVLALLATLFGGMIQNVVVAAIVVLLIHSLNLALGIIDPTIQGLRLQYVEFFSKFFLGGGVPYAPFKRRGGLQL